MPAKTTKIRKDILPFKPVAVELAPLDDNMMPIFTQAVLTDPSFLNSVQFSTSETTEQIQTSDGTTIDIPNGRNYTATVVVNAYNPVFHNFVAGNLEYIPDETLMSDIFTHRLPATVGENETYLQITFGPNKDKEVVPAPDENGNYNFVVEDSYGNPLVRMDKPQFGAYSYDVEANALQFSTEYANAQIRVKYNYIEKDALVYKSDPILKNRLFRLSAIGIDRSAVGGATYKREAILECVYRTGDLTDLPYQSSANSPITYTFSSAPVPNGVSIYTEKRAIVSSGTDGTGSSTDSIVNGGDDKFTTTPNT